MSRRTVRATLVTALATATMVVPAEVSTAAGVTSAPQATPARAVMHLANGAYVTKTTFPSGDSAVVYDVGSPVTVTETTPVKASGSKVAYRGHVMTEQGVGIDVQPTTQISKAAFNQAASLPNVSWGTMLTAEGADQATINSFAAQEALDGPTNQAKHAAASPTAHTASSVKNRRVVSTVKPIPIQSVMATAAQRSWTGHQLLEDYCESYKHEHGSITVHACWKRVIVHKDGPGLQDWWLEDHFFSSATALGLWPISGLKQGETYWTPNVIKDWAPVNAWNSGSCKTITVGFEHWGFSVGASWTDCANKTGLYYSDNQNQITKWDGQGHGTFNARNTAGVAYVQNPPSASASLRHHVSYVWWLQ